MCRISGFFLWDEERTSLNQRGLFIFHLFSSVGYSCLVLLLQKIVTLIMVLSGPTIWSRPWTKMTAWRTFSVFWHELQWLKAYKEDGKTLLGRKHLRVWTAHVGSWGLFNGMEGNAIQPNAFACSFPMEALNKGSQPDKVLILSFCSFYLVSNMSF